MTVTSRQQKLLIIDQVNYPQLVLKHTLESAGYKVTTARDSAEAIRHISAELPDLVLLSLRTDDSDGILTLRALKDYFKLRLDLAQEADPPVIVLSALRDSELMREIQRLDVSRILFKPIDAQELLDSIRSSISGKNEDMSQKRIIILGAEDRSQQFLRSILTDEGYDIETIGSKEGLMELLRKEKLDLCIMDLLPLGDGISETLKSIREIDEEMVIVTIGDSSQDDPTQLGVQRHFTKPLNIHEFREEVDKLLVLQKKEKQTEQEKTEHLDSERAEGDEH
jgi:DNA-binding response OmpR family regulator